MILSRFRLMAALPRVPLMLLRAVYSGSREAEAERHRELARNTRHIVSRTIGKGVLSTAWKKKVFQVPNKEHVEACGRATVESYNLCLTTIIDYYAGACCQAPTHARAGWAHTSRTSPRNNPNTSEQTRMMGFGELDCTMFCVSNKCNRRRAP